MDFCVENFQNERELMEFVRNNRINHEDIVDIVWKAGNSNYFVLFYYKWRNK